MMQLSLNQRITNFTLQKYLNTQFNLSAGHGYTI